MGGGNLKGKNPKSAVANNIIIIFLISKQPLTASEF
jgi:hypothetical protein